MNSTWKNFSLVAVLVCMTDCVFSENQDSPTSFDEDIAPTQITPVEEAWNAIELKTSTSETFKLGVTYSSSIAMSVDQFAYLAAVPNTNRLLEMLRHEVENKIPDGSEYELEIDRQTANRLRVRIHSVKSLVIREHSYWEYIFLDFFISETWPSEGDALSRMVEQSTEFGSSYDSYRICNALRDEERRLRPTYEISLVADGKFAAGGKPGSLKGYNGMETDGFRFELEAFSSNLVSSAVQWFMGNTAKVFNTQTGCLYRSIQ